MNFKFVAIFFVILFQPHQLFAIFRGTPVVAMGEFPFMVQVKVVQAFDEFLQPSKREFGCGGSILSPNIVMTAAHCAQNLGIGSSIKITAGSIQVDQEDHTSQTRLVQQVLFHETTVAGDNSESRLYINDMALMVLNYPFNLNEFVQPIRVPLPDQVFKDNGQIIGFGHTSFKKCSDKIKAPGVLMKANVHILPSSTECVEKMTRDYVQHKLERTPESNRSASATAEWETRVSELMHEEFDAFICAKGWNDTNICSGDSGSPLICTIDNQPHVCGVASWAFGGCGEYRAPGVFAAVANFSEWIHEQISEFNFTCESDEFNCGDGCCIPLTSHCDGKRQCQMGTDELNCHNRSEPEGKQTEGGHDDNYGFDWATAILAVFVFIAFKLYVKLCDLILAWLITICTKTFSLIVLLFRTIWLSC